VNMVNDHCLVSEAFAALASLYYIRVIRYTIFDIAFLERISCRGGCVDVVSGELE
jgi:hypothetical protein